MSCSMLAIGAGPRLWVLNGSMAILPTAELNSRIWEWYAWKMRIEFFFHCYLCHTHNNRNIVDWWTKIDLPALLMFLCVCFVTECKIWKVVQWSQQILGKWIDAEHRGKHKNKKTETLCVLKENTRWWLSMIYVSWSAVSHFNIFCAVQFQLCSVKVRFFLAVKCTNCDNIGWFIYRSKKPQIDLQWKCL